MTITNPLAADLDPEFWDWRQDALCAQVDMDLHHPERGQGDVARRAKAVCGQCDVRAECLEYALETNQDDGIWGGYSGRQLRRLRIAKVTTGIPGGAQAAIIARHKAGLSAVDIAASLGVHVNTVKRYIRLAAAS